MNIKKNVVLVTLSVLSFAILAFTVMSQDTSEQSDNETSVTVFRADPDNLQACGEYFNYITLEEPEATTDAAVPTTAPTQAAATATPRPAPNEDRVGFPENYATDYKLLFIFNRPDRRWLRVICGNEIAAQQEEGGEFAYGSVLLMISYTAKLDENGVPLLDENGYYIGENFVTMHVQRKEEGFGEAYGEDRSGEWEYMAYSLEAQVMTAPQNTNACAACHLNDGGHTVDYTFRMNLFHESETAYDAPELGENEVGIYLYSFYPAILEVSTGTTVTWTNYDEASHTVVTAIVNEDGRVVRAENPLFDSGVLRSWLVATGDSFSFTFEEAGEYLYRSLGDNIVGRIIVTD